MKYLKLYESNENKNKIKRLLLFLDKLSKIIKEKDNIENLIIYLSSPFTTYTLILNDNGTYELEDNSHHRLNIFISNNSFSDLKLNINIYFNKVIWSERNLNFFKEYVDNINICYNIINKVDNILKNCTIHVDTDSNNFNYGVQIEYNLDNLDKISGNILKQINN